MVRERNLLALIYIECLLTLRCNNNLLRTMVPTVPSTSKYLLRYGTAVGTVVGRELT